MNNGRKTASDGRPSLLPPARQQRQPKVGQPRSVQPKMTTARPAKQPPVAPPAFRPQSVPRVLQTKSPSTLAASPAKPAPVAPAAYRPLPGQKTLQPGMAGRQQSHAAASQRQPVAPPVYRPEPKRLVQPKMASPVRETPRATPGNRPAVQPFRPPAPPASRQLKPIAPAANPQITGRAVVQAKSANVIQATFWERTPTGEYIWHYGPVVRALWKEYKVQGMQEMRRGNGYIYSGNYGVWERLGTLELFTEHTPLLSTTRENVNTIVNTVRDNLGSSSGSDHVIDIEDSIDHISGGLSNVIRNPNLDQVQQSLGETNSDKVEYVMKIVGATLGVTAIVAIGASFITVSLPPWVSIASKVFSGTTILARLVKSLYDYDDSKKRGETGFKPTVKNSIYLTIAFTQTMVELSYSGGKYVFATAGWHDELFQLFKLIKLACCGAPSGQQQSQTLTTAEQML